MKERKTGRFLPSLICILLVCVITGLATFMTTYLVMKQDSRRSQAEIAGSYQEALERLEAQAGKDETLSYMQSVVSAYFYGEAGQWSAEGSLDQVYRSYIASLNDPYAAYYSPEEYAEEIADRQGNKAGIGVQVSYDSENSEILIQLVIPGSPAQKAGLLSGDRIVAVDGKRLSDVGYTETVNAISGEIGTDVTITVLREDRELALPVTRDTYVNVSVFGSLCSDGKTGLIRITGFDGATPDQFREAVDDLLEQGAEWLIFDMRNNGGGSLSSVLSVLSYLIEKDQVLIRIYDKEGNATTESSDDEHTVDCPMAVLTNGGTASAAELFTACLRELKDARLVGTTTYGKGCMQSYFKLPNGGGMKLTHKMYNPPSDVSYHGIGIVPDVTAEQDPGYAGILPSMLTEEQDLQLQAALAALQPALAAFG